MSNKPRLVVCFSGFGDALVGEGGISVLVKRIKKETDNTTAVAFTWNTNIHAVADFIERWKHQHKNSQISMAAHSYGCLTAINVAILLWSKNIRVQSMFLSDAVWRRWQYIVSVFSPKGRGELIVPMGVANLYSWYQTETRIRGARLRRECPNLTEWHFHRHVEGTKHTEMDSLPDFHRTVILEN